MKYHNHFSKILIILQKDVHFFKKFKMQISKQLMKQLSLHTDFINKHLLFCINN